MKENVKFNNYIELIKGLSIKEKKKLAYEEIKKLLGFISMAKTEVNLDNKILINKEILDLKNEDVSDEDFIEAMIVLIYSMQEALGEYFNEVSKIIYK